VAKRLTPISVKNVKPPTGKYRREIPDGGCTGLYLLVQPVTGAKSWAVRYRYQGRSRKLTLGNGHFLTLAEAREQATRALGELHNGRDPAETMFTARAHAKQVELERKADTIDNLAAQFLDKHAAKLRPASARQLTYIFHKIVLPRWSGRLIHDIKRRDVIALVEEVSERTPIMANRALAGISKFFNWCLERDVVVASPVAGVKAPNRENVRERVLSDDELRQIWQACDKIGGTGARCVQMLILTGQRRCEVGGMKRTEIEGDTWKLPATRMKARDSHTVPLSAQAMAIIDAQPVMHGTDLIFTNGRAPFMHWHRIKKEIDAHMSPKTERWTLHDLRRSVASGMAGLGIALPVIEKLLAHRSGTFRGIVAVYQKHSFIPEMRHALEQWAQHIDEVVHGRAIEKVVPLKRRR